MPSKKSRQRTKGRREAGHYVQVPTELLKHPNYAELLPIEVKLFFDLYGQYNGFNNGDFTAAWKIMEKLGWKSKSQLYKALKGLVGKGFIVLTRQGGRNKCSLYGVTFQSIDECKGKLDHPETQTALGWWKTGEPQY